MAMNIYIGIGMLILYSALNAKIWARIRTMPHTYYAEPFKDRECFVVGLVSAAVTGYAAALAVMCTPGAWPVFVRGVVLWSMLFFAVLIWQLKRATAPILPRAVARFGCGDWCAWCHKRIPRDPHKL